MPRTSQQLAPRPQSQPRPLAPSSATPLEEQVLAGLRRRPKQLPSAYLYDEEGSRLFQRIMALPEYYVTRAEAEILSTHATRIAEVCAGRRVALVDLGAGDGTKTSVLLDALGAVCDEVVYAPVDICAAALSELAAIHVARHPSVPMTSFVADYARGLTAAGAHLGRARRAVDQRASWPK